MAAAAAGLQEAEATREISLEALIEKEPVTVIMSKRGWIKAMKGHANLSGGSDFKFKEGDKLAYIFYAQTTDKLLLATASGRFYTIGVDKLPGARGFGEPIGTMVDIEAGNDIVALLPADPQRPDAARFVKWQRLCCKNDRCAR